MNYREIRKFARELRKNQTSAEIQLWQYLRGRQLDNRKFLRQHPLLCRFNYNDFFYFIPDFYCHEEKMVIELDGSIHNYSVIEDSQRESIIKKAGFKVVRFKNEELEDINSVLSRIKDQFKQ
jgi:very-short-patch-repair endonuclease